MTTDDDSLCSCGKPKSPEEHVCPYAYEMGEPGIHCRCCAGCTLKCKEGI